MGVERRPLFLNFIALTLALLGTLLPTPSHAQRPRELLDDLFYDIIAIYQGAPDPQQTDSSRVWALSEKYLNDPRSTGLNELSRSIFEVHIEATAALLIQHPRHTDPIFRIRMEQSLSEFLQSGDQISWMKSKPHGAALKALAEELTKDLESLILPFEEWTARAPLFLKIMEKVPPSDKIHFYNAQKRFLSSFERQAAKVLSPEVTQDPRKGRGFNLDFANRVLLRYREGQSFSRWKPSATSAERIELLKAQILELKVLDPNSDFLNSLKKVQSPSDLVLTHTVTLLAETLQIQGRDRVQSLLANDSEVGKFIRSFVRAIIRRQHPITGKSNHWLWSDDLGKLFAVVLIPDRFTEYVDNKNDLEILQQAEKSLSDPAKLERFIRSLGEINLEGEGLTQYIMYRIHQTIQEAPDSEGWMLALKSMVETFEQNHNGCLYNYIPGVSSVEEIVHSRFNEMKKNIQSLRTSND